MASKKSDNIYRVCRTVWFGGDKLIIMEMFMWDFLHVFIQTFLNLPRLLILFAFSCSMNQFFVTHFLSVKWLLFQGVNQTVRTGEGEDAKFHVCSPTIDFDMESQVLWSGLCLYVCVSGGGGGGGGGVP